MLFLMAVSSASAGQLSPYVTLGGGLEQDTSKQVVVIPKDDQLDAKLPALQRLQERILPGVAIAGGAPQVPSTGAPISLYSQEGYKSFFEQGWQ